MVLQKQTELVVHFKKEEEDSVMKIGSGCWDMNYETELEPRKDIVKKIGSEHWNINCES